MIYKKKKKNGGRRCVSTKSLTNIYYQRLDSLKHGKMLFFCSIYLKKKKEFKPSDIYSNLQKKIFGINPSLLLYISLFSFMFISKCSLESNFPYALIEGAKLQYNEIINLTSIWQSPRIAENGFCTVDQLHYDGMLGVMEL